MHNHHPVLRHMCSQCIGPRRCLIGSDMARDLVVQPESESDGCLPKRPGLLLSDSSDECVTRGIGHVVSTHGMCRLAVTESDSSDDICHGGVGHVVSTHRTCFLEDERETHKKVLLQSDSESGCSGLTFAGSLSSDEDEGVSAPHDECILQSDDAEHGVVIDVAEASQWQPGERLESWTTQFPENTLAQMLAVNVMTFLQRLPQAFSRQVVARLPSLSGNRMQASWAARAASALLRLPAGQIKRCAHRLRKGPSRTESAFQPEPRSSGGSVPREGSLPQTASQPNGLEPDGLGVLVDIALGVIADGLPYDNFVRQVARMAKYNVHVGQKHHSTEFVKNVEYLSARCIQSLDSEDMYAPMPGLGIRSSLALLVDGISPGNCGRYARHGTTQVICVALVSPHSHRLCTRFFAAPETVGGHDGQALCDDVMAALLKHGANISRKSLARGVLALVGGDGAFCKGGSSRTSPSTGAAERIWMLVYPQRRNLAALSEDAPLIALTASSPTVYEPQLLVCTEWDKWHRLNKIVSRAAEATPLSEELYEVGALMDSLFGVNEGKSILRAAADATGLHLRSLHMPGATRKHAALVAEPGNFLTNLKVYAAGLHVRKAWKRAGHSNFNLSTLEDAGRRSTAVDLVAFALLSRDLMRQAVAPAASFSQSLQEPWLAAIAIDRWQRQLDSLASVVCTWREMLRVTFLLRQWVDSQRMDLFVKACFYASSDDFFLGADRGTRSARVWGRALPSFMQTFHEMALEETPHFNGLELLRTQAVPDLICLGPHCQCSFHADSAGATVGVPGRPTRLARVTIARRGRPLAVNVPLWVKYSPVGAVQPHSKVYAPAPLRFHHRSTTEIFRSRLPDREPSSAQVLLKAPKKVAHRVLNAFVKSHHSRCQLKAWMPVAFDDLDRALLHIQIFIVEMRKQSAELFGSEGVNDCMTQLVQWMRQCFDWQRLALERPSVADLRAFCDLSERLRPVLQHTLWPDASTHPLVKRVWSSRDELGTQYMQLTKRVRDAPNAMPDLRAKWNWQSMKGHMVQPLRVGGVVCTAVLRLLSELYLRRDLETLRTLRHGLVPHSQWPSVAAVALKRALHCRVAALISAFVNRAPETFFVSRGGLRKCGFMHTSKRNCRRKDVLHLRKAVRERWEYSSGPGGVCALVRKDRPPILVYVLRSVFDISAVAVSASLDADPYFSNGPTASSRSAWHAVRVHHQCRLMGVPEACCERVGSIMDSLWSKRRNATLSSFVDRTHVREALVHAIGGSRDEQISQMVVDALRRRGYKSDGQKKMRRRHERQGIKVSMSVDKAIRAHDDQLIACGRLSPVQAVQQKANVDEEDEKEEEDAIVLVPEWEKQKEEETEGKDEDQEEEVLLCGVGTASTALPRPLQIASPRLRPTASQRLRLHSGVDLRSARQQGARDHNKPHQLNSAIREMLKDVTKNNKVQALPRVIRDARVDSRSVADSSKKRMVDNWFRGEQGRDWSAKRLKWSKARPSGDS